MNWGYEQFVSQLDEAIASFPSLSKATLEGAIILKGILPVIDKEGKHWEDYDIEIHCSKNFPYEFPLLFETSGKIPKIADWHVYEDSLTCCVKVHPEELLRCKKGITVKEYISDEVLPYLFNQTHRRVEGYYINGEYSHGSLGVYEYYANMLNTDTNIKLTLQLMNFIADHERPSRTSMCFCEKRIKFRHCHKGSFDKIKPLGSEQIKRHVSYILQGYKTHTSEK